MHLPKQGICVLKKGRKIWKIIIDRLKKISGYVKNTKSSLLDLERYLRFEVYGLILDFDSISEDFFQSHPEILVNTIYAIKNIKNELEHNRSHTKEKKTYLNFLRRHMLNKFLRGEYTILQKKNLTSFLVLFVNCVRIVKRF